MPTYLLTWNPDRWPWNDIEAAIQQTATGKLYFTQWSTGNRKRMFKGERVFLLKQGEPPRGIIAAGWVVSESIYEYPHFLPERKARGDNALRGDFEFDRVLSPPQALSVEDIETVPLSEVEWHPLASGNSISDNAAAGLEELWAAHLRSVDDTIPLSPDAGATDSYSPSDEDSRPTLICEIQARRGQQAFRDALRRRYGNRCLISGCTLLDVLEAAHVRPHRGEKDNHPENGLLLRADLHTLFDLNLLGIDPATLIVHIKKRARAEYGQFDGIRLQCSEPRPSEDALKIRWREFLNL